ncbi:MAG: hypothetical protein FWF59_15100 [Turicibacter sp.]|nr:hypothetical protein [Turicibacter sp.]
MSKPKAPMLFIDSIPKGCVVKEQQIDWVQHRQPEEIRDNNCVRVIDRRTASDLNKWPEENT